MHDDIDKELTLATARAKGALATANRQAERIREAADQLVHAGSRLAATGSEVLGGVLGGSLCALVGFVLSPWSPILIPAVPLLGVAGICAGILTIRGRSGVRQDRERRNYQLNEEQSLRLARSYREEIASAIEKGAPDERELWLGYARRLPEANPYARRPIGDGTPYTQIEARQLTPIGGVSTSGVAKPDSPGSLALPPAGEQGMSLPEGEISDAFFNLFMNRQPLGVLSELDAILRHRTIRHSCRYRIILKRPYAEMPEASFVIREEVTFVIKNLLDEEAQVNIRSHRLRSVSGFVSSWNRPYYLRLCVDNEAIALDNQNAHRWANHSFIDHAVVLGPRGSMEVHISGEEPSFLDAACSSYFLSELVLGVEVEVLNEYPEAIQSAEVQINHPGMNEVRQDALGRYFLGRALLPGQGFQVLWSKVQNDASGL